MSNKPETQVVIGPVRFSFVQVWEPKAMDENSKPKFSVSIIIPKSDTKLIAKIEKAIEAAKEAGKSKFGGKIPKGLKMPLRDGDEDRDDEAYKDSMFIGANSLTRPQIVDANRDPIMDQEEFYSGCYGYVSVNFYAYDVKSKGIAAGLNNIMKTKDGEPLSGRTTAANDFADIEVEEAPGGDLL